MGFIVFKSYRCLVLGVIKNLSYKSVISIFVDDKEVMIMDEQFLENDSLEWLDALEIGFDLTDYELDDVVIDDAFVIDNL